MYEFQAYYTADGSVGLYNSEFQDIYHSASGALSEAYEKFIMPVDIQNLLKKNSIHVLDICFGIGYNSKSFLNYIFENYILKNKKFEKNTNIDTIDTNNIKNQNHKINTYTIYTNNTSKNKHVCSTSIDEIYDNNIFSKISVTAIDNDKILSYLSPFIKTGIKNFKNKNIEFLTEQIKKYLTNKNSKKKLKIHELINFLIFEKITQNHPDFLEDSDIHQIINSKENKAFFDTNIRGIYNLYNSKHDKILNHKYKNSFLHNIYYNHISNKYKNGLKTYQLCDINFKLIIDDARNFIKNDDTKYNLIFLDAFTPSKCPCLWSYDFFKVLYSHLEQDGLILTYSTSASIRSAMQEVGFAIGNIYDSENKNCIGTVATKNNALIKYPLSDYDLGLLKTRAGIFYRDENLTALNEAIKERRELEIKSSNRISSSKYRKQYFN